MSSGAQVSTASIVDGTGWNRGTREQNQVAMRNRPCTARGPMPAPRACPIPRSISSQLADVSFCFLCAAELRHTCALEGSHVRSGMVVVGVVMEMEVTGVVVGGKW